MQGGAKNIAFWLLLFLIIAAVFSTYEQPEKKNVEDIKYSYFKTLVLEDKINKVTIQDRLISGTYLNGAKFRFRCKILKITDGLLKFLEKNKVEINFEEKPEPSFLSNLFWTMGPTLLFIFFLWFVFYKNMSSMGKGPFSFGKSKAKLFTTNLPKVTFKDVAGCEEAKKELEEIIDFLKAPKKFQRLGGRIPKGVLVVGPPGTGKTLLARAVAGEAGVPFFSLSGSDFVEMFVGVGASRVRDLFEQGKKHAPCIIFIDEIDAVGRQRGAGLGGGHDEREQTLNALLVEMDGFETKEGVILIAATNRPDVLDPALLRPGRFDRNVIVDKPDLKGRVGILKVHSKKIPLDLEVDLEVIARGCPGFSGADLENLMNEAALLAARRNLEVVTKNELEEAKDKVLMGPERKSMVIRDKEKKETAYHEAGHALVAEMIPGTDPLHKITIIPRGRALGVTIQLPEYEKHCYTKEYLLARIAIMMGGRAAENIIFQAPTSGASNDIERATEMARSMVCELGMSDKIGPVQFGKKETHPFLGRELSHNKNHSEKTAIEIDNEIKRIVLEQYNLAEKILTDNRSILDAISELLIKNETIDGEEVRAIIRGEELISHETEKSEESILVGIKEEKNLTIFTFDGAMFEPLKEELLESAKSSLLKVIDKIKQILESKKEFLKIKPPRIEILGFTDSLGNLEQNKVLAEKRAEYCKNILVENEIPENYIVTIAKGETEPIGDNATVEGRRKNRRIRIVYVEPTKAEIAKQTIDTVIGEIINKNENKK